MFTEIIHIRENYTQKVGDISLNRINLIVVNITPQHKLICIQQIVDADTHEVLAETCELCDTYKQMMAFVEIAMYYTNGNEYKQ